MGFLSKVWLNLLQFLGFSAAFIAVAIMATMVIPYLTAQKLKPYDSPSGPFFVVIGEHPDDDHAKTVFRLYDWEKVKLTQSMITFATFMLPGPTEILSNSESKPCEIQSYRVLANGDGEQLIETRCGRENYDAISRYKATRDKVVPVYSRLSQVGHVFPGMLAGLVAAVLINRPLRRFLFKARGLNSRP